MRVLVSGASGQLAVAISLLWHEHELFLPAESLFDLADPTSIKGVIKKIKPEVVINCAAFTQVDRCEFEPDRADLINRQAVRVLAESCTAAGALLVQISTDYVFDGKGLRPYREDDEPNPCSVYGSSKLAGEHEAGKSAGHLIIRTSWLYDAWGRNFYRTMLDAGTKGKALKVVNDQRGAPTSCRALARQIKVAVEEGWRGTVHATCHGETTWFGFASEIFRQAGMDVQLSPCTTEEYPLPAIRPAFSVLDSGRRKAMGSDVMPSWVDALAEVVNHPQL